VQICLSKLQELAQHPLRVLSQKWCWPTDLPGRDTGTERRTGQLSGPRQRVCHRDKGAAFDKMGIGQDLQCEQDHILWRCSEHTDPHSVEVAIGETVATARRAAAPGDIAAATAPEDAADT
jgi:hypothetical protein